jgi:hypothetical protein
VVSGKHAQVVTAVASNLLQLPVAAEKFLATIALSSLPILDELESGFDLDEGAIPADAEDSNMDSFAKVSWVDDHGQDIEMERLLPESEAFDEGDQTSVALHRPVCLEKSTLSLAVCVEDDDEGLPTIKVDSASRKNNTQTQIATKPSTSTKSKPTIESSSGKKRTQKAGLIKPSEGSSKKRKKEKGEIDDIDNIFGGL